MKKDNIKYIGFMIFSMAGFAVEDAIIKKLSSSMPISQVLISIGFVGLVVFFLFARLRKTSLFSRQIKKILFLFRMFCELISSILFVMTIVFVSLSVSSAILQVTPLIVAIGASVFFKQNILIHQWVLIFIGLFGVLLVIQPGTQFFSPISLLALVGSFFLALRDLATRSIAKSIPAITVGFWGFFSLTVGGFLCIPLFGQFEAITMNNFIFLGLSAFFGPIAYLSLILATRGGDVAVTSPYRYTRLPFALLLGVFLFDEKPNEWMLLGCFFIITTGILILLFSGRKN